MQKVRDGASRVRMVRLVLATTLIVAGVATLYTSGVWRFIPRVISQSGVYGILISYALVVLQTVIPFVPFALLAGFNASIHGFWMGYLSTWAGAFTGSMILYYLSSRLMTVYFRRKLDGLLLSHPKLLALEEKIVNSRGFSSFFVILMLRMQPWLPASIIDITSGLSRVRLSAFVAATILGQGPMVALESYVGHRILHFQSHQRELFFIAGGSLLVLLLYWAILYWRKGWVHRLRR